MPGGRAGLIRIAAILGNSYLGFPIPDYSAYSEMLSLFKNVSGIVLSYILYIIIESRGDAIGTSLFADWCAL